MIHFENDIGEYIPDFDQKYAITEHGEIYSFISQRFLKKNFDKDGYEIINLQKNGKGITCKVHRLVAITYIQNPMNYPQVNHIDGNKKNNSVSNLEWCDQSHNMRHLYSELKYSQSNEHRHKNSLANSGKNNAMYGVRRLGSSSPCYGKPICKGYKWIHKDGNRKRVNVDCLQNYINNGWRLGFAITET